MQKSNEPLLADPRLDYRDLDWSGISWVVIGSQTKPTVYPKLEWVREIVEAADRAGVKVFLKDNLRPVFEKDVEADGYNQLYFRGDELRQEMPMKEAQ